MADRLATIHVVEESARHPGRRALFAVDVLLTDDTVEGMREGDRAAWRCALARTRRLIRQHRRDVARARLDPPV
jgi:hypothetical protein